MPQYEPPFPPTTRRRTATQEERASRFVAAQQPIRTTTTRQPVQRLIENYPQASPHRVGHTPGIHPEDQPYMSQEVRHTRRPPVGEELDYPDDPPRRRTTVVV